MAAFIIANGAAAMGSRCHAVLYLLGSEPVTKKPEPVSGEEEFHRNHVWLDDAARCRKKPTLSKMNMAGMGTMMIKGIMKKKNVASLSELIDKAKENGVRLVACAMSMDLMGIRKEELIDGVEEGGVAMYLNQAESAGVNLFI